MVRKVAVGAENDLTATLPTFMNTLNKPFPNISGILLMII